VLASAGFARLTFEYDCFGGCSTGTIGGVIRPVFFGGLALSVSLFLLLFFPPTIFKKWLLHIASWYLPVSLLIVASIPAFGGGMLMPSRGIMAVQMMAVLFVITVVYSSYQRFYLKTGVKV
jgi:hypothetical protein